MLLTYIIRITLSSSLFVMKRDYGQLFIDAYESDAMILIFIS